MVLAVYDVATLAARKRAERVLRQANFVFLFGNMRWASRTVDLALLKRRLRSALRGDAYRILLLEIPVGSIEHAAWLHGSFRGRPE